VAKNEKLGCPERRLPNIHGLAVLRRRQALDLGADPLEAAADAGDLARDVAEDVRALVRLRGRQDLAPLREHGHVHVPRPRALGLGPDEDGARVDRVQRELRDGDPAVRDADERDRGRRLDGHGDDDVVERRQQLVDVHEHLADELDERARRRREHRVVLQVEELGHDRRRLRRLELDLELVDLERRLEGREAPDDVQGADRGQHAELAPRHVVDVEVASHRVTRDQKTQRRREPDHLEQHVPVRPE